MCSRAVKIAVTRGVRPPVVGGAAGARPAMLKLSPKVVPDAPRAVEMRGTEMTGLVVTDLVVTDLVVKGLAAEGLTVAGGGGATQDGTIGVMEAAAGMAPKAVPRATMPR